MIRCILAPFAVASRRVPQASSFFACVARRHDGVFITRASLVLACRWRAPPAPSTFPRVARCHDGVACVSRPSCFHLGMCLRRRRSSLVSLVVAAASKSLALLSRSRVVGARLPRHRPSFASRVATMALPHCVSLAFPSGHAPQAPSVFASLIVTAASHITRASLALACYRRAPPAPSTPPRCARRHDCVASVSRLSRFHLGVCLRRRRSSLASLVVTAASYITRTPLALAYCRRAPPTPSTFPCIARRHDGVAGVSRLSRFHLGVCLRRRRSSLASLVATAESHITRVSLALVCRRRAPPASSTFLRFARRHDSVACVSRLSRFLSGVGLRCRRSLLASLVVTKASQITPASLAPACRRRAPLAPSTFFRFARRHHGVA